MTLLPPFSEFFPQDGPEQVLPREGWEFRVLVLVGQEISGRGAVECQQCIQGFLIGDQGEEFLVRHQHTA